MTINAVSLLGAKGYEANAASDVLALGHRFYVGGIRARGVAAKVVKGQTVGDWANQFLIDDSMNQELLVVPSDQSVTPLVPTSPPLPTAIRDANAIPEAFMERKRRVGSIRNRVTVAVPMEIVALAPTASMCRTTAIGNSTLSTHRNHPFGDTEPDVNPSRLRSILSDRLHD